MDVLVFGNRMFASLAWHALTHDSPHTRRGLHRGPRIPDGSGTMHDLPVVPFEEAERRFDPGGHRDAAVGRLGRR